MSSARYRIGPFTLNISTGEVSNEDGVAVHLTAKELLILGILVDQNDWVSRPTLLSKAWKEDEGTVSSHTLSVHVSHLRKKLGKELLTDRRRGCKLNSCVPLDIDVPNRLCPTWKEMCADAQLIGEYVFYTFKADAVLTFAGHSAIFANLAIVSCRSRKQLLDLPVYLALQVDWCRAEGLKNKPRLTGYHTLCGESVAILIPMALIEILKKRKRRTYKLAIIDDSIVSGDVPTTLKTSELARKAKMSFACWVCFGPMTRAISSRKPDKVARWLWTKEDLEDFRTPYGTPLLWFGQNQEGSRDKT